MVNKKGFTLIEALVSTGIMAVILIVIVGILLDIFKARRRNSLNNSVYTSGSLVISELRKNLLRSASSKVTCPGPAGVGSSLSMINLYDDNETVIKCDAATGRIASESASGTKVIVLNSADVGVSNCDTFISCSTLPSSFVSKIDFSFSLSSTIPQSSEQVVKDFSTSVTLRN